MYVTTPILASYDIKIKGQTLTALPNDLYIPPGALEVYLEAFEGPLDLLLYLIRKHNLDILDIPMTALTLQYMDYVEKMKAIKLELAADYLLMSAMLIEIKSRMLLPKPPAVEEEEDPRAELVRRLMEYEAIKLAAQRLDTMPVVGEDIQVSAVELVQHSQTKSLELHLNELIEAWENVLKRAKLMQHHRIGRAELSVREHMSIILRRLSGASMLRFDELLSTDEQSIAKLVVNFLAILELNKDGLIRLSQQQAFATIYIQGNSHEYVNDA